MSDAPSKEKDLHTYLLIYRGKKGANDLKLPELLADVESFEPDSALKCAKEIIKKDSTKGDGIDVYVEGFDNQAFYLALCSISKPGSNLDKAYVISEGRSPNSVKIDAKSYVDKMESKLKISEDIYIVPVIKIKTVVAETMDMRPEKPSERIEFHDSYDPKILYQRRQMPGFD